MNIDFEKEIKNLQKISLTAEEKNEMRDYILSRAPIYAPRRFTFGYRVLAPAVLVLLLVIVGGTHYVSGRALPGEALYSVKIVGENITEVLSFTNKARTEAKITQAARRLEEAEKLFSQGKLDAEKQTEIGQAFAQISEDTLSRIVALKESEPETDAHEETAASFEGMLEAHEDILSSKLNPVTEEEPVTMLSMTVSVPAEEATSSEPASLKSAQEKISSLPTQVQSVLARLRESASIDKEIATTTKELAEKTATSVTYRISEIEKIYLSLNDEYKDRVGPRLELIKTFYQKGEEYMEAGEYAPALSMFKQALRKAAQTKSLAESYSKVSE